MVEMDELIVLATDDEPVRRYLRRMGIAERVITRYPERAGHGDSVAIGFGRDDVGEIPPLRLRCPDGLGFELTSPGGGQEKARPRVSPA
jgi:hypothetical protein